MINEFAAVIVKTDRLWIPLNLESFHLRTIHCKLLYYLIDVNAGGDLFEPTKWCSDDNDSLQFIFLCIFLNVSYYT